MQYLHLKMTGYKILPLSSPTSLSSQDVRRGHTIGPIPTHINSCSLAGPLVNHTIAVLCWSGCLSLLLVGCAAGGGGGGGEL